MSDNSKIEWTDATWQPITGCSIASPGCTNCYAMRLAGTRLNDHPSRAGLTKCINGNHVWTGEVRFNEKWLTQPLRWRKPRKIFVCAHGDLFHDSVPDGWIDRVFAIMALAPQHTFQVLTKRSKRMHKYLTGAPWGAIEDAADEILTGGNPFHVPETLDRAKAATAINRRPLPNVLLGVSAEDQKRADERIPDLIATPAAKRFVSIEPMLGPVDLTKMFFNPAEFKELLHLVICGGESGPGARPMHPAWPRGLLDQCKAAGVPFFFKQHGAWLCGRDDNGNIDFGCARMHVFDDEESTFHVGKKAAGRMLDGEEHNGMPEDTP